MIPGRVISASYAIGVPLLRRKPRSRPGTGIQLDHLGFRGADVRSGQKTSGNSRLRSLRQLQFPLGPLEARPLAQGSGSGAGPWGAFVHPSGKFLNVTNNGAGTISGYTIDSTSGALTPISGSPFVASGSGSNGTYVIAFSN